MKCIAIIAILFLQPACTTAPDPRTQAFQILNQPAHESKFSASITPSARGMRIDTEHPLESSVDEIGGKITLTLKW